MVANLLAMLRRRQLALTYAERARLLAQEVEDKQALFRALTMGQLPAFIFGRWDEAEYRLEKRSHSAPLCATCTDTDR